MYMKKLIKKQVSLSLVTAILLGIVIIGSSYALFQDSFSDTNTQSLNVGDLNVAFSNTSNQELSNNDAIDIASLSPMPDATALTQNDNLYSFVVTNNGDVSYCYTIKLQDNPLYTTNLLNHSYIRYKLNSESPKMLSETTNGYIVSSRTINPNETDSYQLRIWVADAETYQLPNETIGQEVHLNVVIEGEACAPRAPEHWNASTRDTLIGSIRTNYPTPTATLTTPGVNSSTEQEAVLASTEDDYGTSYYFRGAVENNYVSFAGMCWRIVRIVGDGSIKLTLYNYNPTGASNPCAASLDGETKAFARYDDTTDGQNGLSAFNQDYNKNTYVGFMYSDNPDSNDYATAHANDNDSTILANLKLWYDRVFSQANKDKLADVIWCNDKRVVNDITYNPRNSANVIGTGVGSDITYYQAAKRLIPSSEASPSLKCGESKTDNLISKFTASTSTDGGYGNGALNGYKIGLLTADEIVFAGTINEDTSNNNSYYLNKNASDAYFYWTLTPVNFDGTGSGIFRVRDQKGDIGHDYVHDSSNDNSVRPAIALKYNTSISGGNGTQASPFVVN